MSASPRRIRCLEGRIFPCETYYARVKLDNDPSIAEQHYKKAVELDPGDGELHRMLGLFYKLKNRIQWGVG